MDAALTVMKHFRSNGLTNSAVNQTDIISFTKQTYYYYCLTRYIYFIIIYFQERLGMSTGQMSLNKDITYLYLICKRRVSKYKKRWQLSCHRFCVHFYILE